MKSVKIYMPQGEVLEYKEGVKQCQTILDRSDDYPVVRVFMHDHIKIFKGMPFVITADKYEGRDRA